MTGHAPGTSIVAVRWRRLLRFYSFRSRILIAAWAAMIIAAVIVLAGCGSSHSTGQARASARATASAIAQGQAAVQAEGIARACARKYSGIPLINCMLPHAPRGAHRRAFDRCALNAMAADIPGREARFVNADLPECLVVNR